MPQGDLIAWVGETLSLSFQEHSPDSTDLTLSGVTATVWDEAGTAAPSAAAGGVDATADGGPVAFYLWTPSAAGDYTWELKYAVGATGYLGAETRARTGSAQVWPRTSLLRPFLDRARGLTADAARALGEDAAALSLRDYAESFQDALRAYSDAHPRLLQSDVTLTGSQWEYNLSTLAAVAAGTAPAAQWTPEFSEITSVEPKVDATVPSQWFVGAGDVRAARVGGYGYLASPVEVVIDEGRGTWRFSSLYPSTGDVARVRWTAPHIVTHTASSLPSEPVSGRAVYFEALCRYAAGEALGRLASRAAGNTNEQIDAQIVNYGTTFERYQVRANALKAEATKAWEKRTWAF